jgi:diadenosine tetraphosphate (Ap4A) HIT family hydrolase
MECLSCRQGPGLPPRERIAGDDHWRVAHGFNSALPGWLVLIPRRHITAIADLTDEEAAGLGLWQVRLSRALRDVTGCVKTYVIQFAEQDGFAHVHFHIVPRMPDLPADHRGPRIFGYLQRPPAEQVPVEEMDRLAEEIAAAVDSESNLS